MSLTVPTEYLRMEFLGDDAGPLKMRSKQEPP